MLALTGCDGICCEAVPIARFCLRFDSAICRYRQSARWLYVGLKPGVGVGLKWVVEKLPREKVAVPFVINEIRWQIVCPCFYERR